MAQNLAAAGHEAVAVSLFCKRRASLPLPPRTVSTATSLISALLLDLSNAVTNFAKWRLVFLRKSSARAGGFWRAVFCHLKQSCCRVPRIATANGLRLGGSASANAKVAISHRRSLVDFPPSSRLFSRTRTRAQQLLSGEGSSRTAQKKEHFSPS